jgi:ankyrin repeat protein
VIKAVVQPLVAAARAQLSERKAEGTWDPAAPGPALEALRRAVNARDAAGRTPLHLAAKRGHLGCVK